MHRHFRSLKTLSLVAVCGLVATLQSAFAAVGYVNVAMTNGYTLVVNPLNNANNSVTNVIPSPPEGTRVWLWNVTNQVFDPPATFTDTTLGWTTNLLLTPGRGFVVHAP